jgi:biofilm PGA synthesis lipoprotein PgaB
LSFHDVVASQSEIREADDVTVDNLVNYFSWLKENDYSVVSIQDVIDSSRGKKSLPVNAVMLTFDDGYKSFYKYVLPLLKTFNYPATLAIVGSWLDVKESGTVLYGGKRLPRSHFLSIAELREISRSPLVEIASHSFDMHRGVLGNFQGNEMPAITTFAFDPSAKVYETKQDYLRRIKQDLMANNQWIKKNLNLNARVMVWPYGRYNATVQRIAQSIGLEVALALDDAEDMNDQSLDRINRLYVANNPTITQFADLLRGSDRSPTRVMHVDLDYIYDPDPDQQEKNLGLLLERIKASGVNTVYLQAFSDDAGSGVAKSLYFNNRHLPVKADLFGRASWQIRTRLKVNVYAWMPLLAFDPGPDKRATLDWVQSVDGSAGIGYLRLSPFSERSRQFVKEIYEDLARYSYFYGILIHDDATLSDKEDASPAALAYYQTHWGLPPNVSAITSDPSLRQKWIAHKTEALTNFALELKKVAEEYKKPLRIARNYYAEVALNPASEEWFAQSMTNGLSNFDGVALMAMPYMEKAVDPIRWLRNLVNKTEKYPQARQKVIYELQAKNWETKKAIPDEELRHWMRMLRIQGALNFGYYPDDPHTNEPKIEVIRKELSTQSEIFD